VKVVAYGPPAKGGPHVPEFLVIRDGSLLLRAIPEQTPDSEISLNPLLANGRACLLPEPLEWKSGHWLVFQNLTHEWILANDIHNWKMQRAQEVLDAAYRTEAPDQRIETLKAAAATAGVKLDDLLEGLEQVRSTPEERYEQLFKRFKDWKPPSK